MLFKKMESINHYTGLIGSKAYQYRKYYFVWIGVGCAMMAFAIMSSPQTVEEFEPNNNIQKDKFNYEVKARYPSHMYIYPSIGIKKGDNELEFRNCTRNSECGNGKCTQDGIVGFSCECDTGYIDRGNEICSYHQRSTLVAFLLSFFVGGVGADWFYLARGNADYIVAGVFKFITMGGFGIWWLVDWIRILAGDFKDGNGVKLAGW